MKRQLTIPGRYMAILWAALVALGLYLSSLYSYLLFHSIAELFSIVVAYGIFMVAWNSRRFSDNNYLLFIGVAYAFIGVLDLIHTLGYPGMGIFRGYGTNLAAQLWIAARYIQSLSLLIAPLLLDRKLRINLVLVGYATAISLLLASIFYWNIFPVCFAEGTGLTPFKKVSEYIISLILLASIYLLFQKRRQFDEGVFRLLVASIIVTIGAELAFTLYTGPYALPNQVGHFLKIVSFYLVYEAIIGASLTKPYNLLFRNLKQSEEALQKAKDELEVKVEERTCDLNKSNEQLQQEVSERKRAEARIINLNSVLKALRSVNQLIVHEKDREHLIQKSCDLMVETRGFLCAWILLFDEKREYISAAVAGGKEMQAFSQQLEQGNYPPCIDRIVAHKNLFAVCDDTVENGVGCLPKGCYSGGTGLISRLEYEGKVYGIVSVYVPSDYALVPEEQSLFKELAGDIVFALVGIEKEEQRKRAEEQLRESQEFTSSLLNNAPNPILVLNPDASIRYVNPALETATGYTAQEVIGRKPPYPWWAPEVAAELSSTSTANISQGVAARERLFQRKNGEQFWVELTRTSIKDNNGQLKYSVSVWVDITERKRAETALERAANEWRATFDAISDMVSIHNKDFRIVRVNQAFARTLKIIPQEAIGQACYELIHGTKEPLPGCPYMQTLETGTPSRKEFLDPHLEMYMEVACSPIFNEKGEVVATVHIARDITERRKMEAQLMVTDRLASIGELASGIAHELNNPLTSVIGFSDLLLERDLTGEVREDLKVINLEAHRTAQVVRNLLTFARKHPQEKQLVDINEVIQKVLVLRAYEHKVSNIEVETRLAPDLPQIMADGFQLQQVFLNIIINAEYFMAEAHGRGTLTIATEQVGDIMRASLTDDGMGISKESMRHLFNPFFTTKEVGKGTGLGLSICHGVVTAHGGRIYAESELGQGATFIVELPITGNREA